MRKTMTMILSLLVALSLVLSACTTPLPGSAPPPPAPASVPFVKPDIADSASMSNQTSMTGQTDAHAAIEQAASEALSQDTASSEAHAETENLTEALDQEEQGQALAVTNEELKKAFQNACDALYWLYTTYTFNDPLRAAIGQLMEKMCKDWYDVALSPTLIINPKVGYTPTKPTIYISRLQYACNMLYDLDQVIPQELTEHTTINWPIRKDYAKFMARWCDTWYQVAWTGGVPVILRKRK